jgi:UDPglucose 6-dehydrogenase
MDRKKSAKIGFIGQGFVGKNYADDFELRGMPVVRYALEEPYARNKEKIAECDVVFIAVPTPTTSDGFDGSMVRDAIKLTQKGTIVVIKSTVLPGTTESLQEQYSDRFILHSPEFLSEATAAHDAAHPARNIVGIPVESAAYRRRAEEVLALLPPAPYARICTAREAEFIKYGKNCLGYVRIIFTNLMYDLAQSAGADWKTVQEAMAADPDTGSTYLNPVHKSGRGAGGHCFIKDFAAFRNFFDSQLNDAEGSAVLRSIEEKNLSLLRASGKDAALVAEVYGKTGKKIPRKRNEKRIPQLEPLRRIA